MSDLLRRFKDYISEKALFQQEDGLLLAVSGGLDSVVLGELCKQAGYHFIIAHCHFGLRGTESDRDENFVAKLAAGWSRPFLVKHFNTDEYARDHKCSVQVAARELRYQWFKELLDNSSRGLSTVAGGDLLPLRFLLTAHHLDDNIETLLMNFFKGTGIEGLKGISPKQGSIVRPLLFATKEALREFASQSQLDWVEDSSNASDKYSRNYLRHQFLPVIQKIYPEAMQNLASNLERFTDIAWIYRESIIQFKKKLLETRGDEFHIPVLKLKKSIPLRTVIYEVFSDFGFGAGQVDELLRLLDSDSGKFILSATHRVLKNRQWLIISPRESASAQTILISDGSAAVDFPGGQLQFARNKLEQSQLSTDPNSAQLDGDLIEFPLILRRWKPGDYFYPLGMRKKKKLGRFFIDQKLSRSDKEKIWLLEMNKKIIWILGMRIDDRFKITASTRNVLLIKMRVF